MAAQLIPVGAPKLDAELQAVLTAVRALVAARDGLCRELAQLKTDSARQVEHMIAERDGLEQAILKAPHGLACASWADQACDCWKSDVRLGDTGVKPTVSNLIGATSQAGYAQPCRCDRDDNGTWHGRCTCAQPSDDKAKRAVVAERDRLRRRVEALEANMNPEDVAAVDAALSGDGVRRG